MQKLLEIKAIPKPKTVIRDHGKKLEGSGCCATSDRQLSRAKLFGVGGFTDSTRKTRSEIPIVDRGYVQC